MMPLVCSSISLLITSGLIAPAIRSYRIGSDERYLRYRQQQRSTKDQCYLRERQFWLDKMEDYLAAGADATAFPLSDSLDGEKIIGAFCQIR
nr:hypothetical protein [Pectobacterium brasiliense]